MPQQLANSPLYQWGLAAGNARPARFISAALVPVSPWLCLALLALLPLAMASERRLGSGRTLALWLLGSIVAGIGYLLTSRAGQSPFHGAVGWFALSGAFFLLYRQPLSLSLGGRALVIRPLWLMPLPLLALTTWALLNPPLPSALTAALAALLTGASLALLLQPAAPDEDAEQDEPAPDPQQVRLLSEGWEALGQLNGSAASHSFQQVLADQPRHFDALTGLFTASQQQQDIALWEDTAHRLFVHPASGPEQCRQVLHCWQQFRQRHGADLPAPVGWPLVATLARGQAFADAEALADRLDNDPAQHAALSTLIATLESEGLTHRSGRWKEKLQTR